MTAPVRVPIARVTLVRLSRPQLVPASLDEVLVSGGDARLVPDARSGRNGYGLRARPEEELAAFGSSTASPISPRAFAAAAALHDKLVDDPAQSAGEWPRLRTELAGLLGLPPTVDVILSPSGTDAHLLGAALWRAGATDERPGLVIQPEAAETGSGVPAALALRHFGDRAALGGPVEKGARLSSAADHETAIVPLRGADGTPRTVEAIDAEVVERVEAAVAEGRRVLVLVTEGSKTGLCAPGVAQLVALRDRFPGRLDVLVDACQLRSDPARLVAHLARGFLVAVTGSKFISGPSFAGALLVPAAAALHGRRLPSVIAAYSGRSEWPARYRGRLSASRRDNLGLLLRWEAALAELRAFRALPAKAVDDFLGGFAASIGERLQGDPAFRALPEGESHPQEARPGWDRHATIFAFALRESAGGAILDAERTARVYRALVAGVPGRGPDGARFHLGQPVASGAGPALRLCASARHCIEAAESEASARAVIARAHAALDEAARAAQA